MVERWLAIAKSLVGDRQLLSVNSTVSEFFHADVQHGSKSEQKVLLYGYPIASSRALVRMSLYERVPYVHLDM